LILFHKYHGAGNDFILLDDREGKLTPHFDQPTIAHWCDRHFGIGADGLMLLRNHPEYDFEMIYYNSDGAPSSMCGNGGRCIVRFAADLGILKEGYNFLAVDGPHRANLLPNGWVSLEMLEVTEVARPQDDVFVLDTGSPHYITFRQDISNIDVFREGRSLRNSAPYKEKGININFVSEGEDGLNILTYERGVEDETLACGTGVTAAAIAAITRAGVADGCFRVPVKAKGGDLAVRGQLTDGRFTNLWLEGPAVRAFGGEME
jgi:diaminopimelate epimerase